MRKTCAGCAQPMLSKKQWADHPEAREGHVQACSRDRCQSCHKHELRGTVNGVVKQAWVDEYVTTRRSVPATVATPRTALLWRGDHRREWYDWALVWRYWHGQAEGLRTPTYPEARELLRLAREAGLGPLHLSRRTGVPERTIFRWIDRFAESNQEA